MKTVSFAPAPGPHRLYAIYRRPSVDGERQARVHGWLTVEGENGARQVLPAVIGPDGHLIPAGQYAGRGVSMEIREEIQWPSPPCNQYP
ncbi:hypothetical protein ACT8ZV_12845 [Nocardioides sp. MAHUQ-72]|uniref:hypothetical protein n=1 Tax=unclassified Nocardioides TaxID=2615069 RepID=UPI00361D370D